MIKSSPEVTLAPRFGPNLDSTVRPVSGDLPTPIIHFRVHVRDGPLPLILITCP